MNFSEIKEIVALVDQSSLTEFHVKEQQFELYLNKNKQTSSSIATNNVPVAESAQSAVAAIPTTSVENVDVAVESNPAPAVAMVEGNHPITSPLVGVVYLKPSPDKPVFKQVGDLVVKGEVVCIIEAMKVMNEIVSDVDGVITAVLIENEEVVEFGQPIFQVKEG